MKEMNYFKKIEKPDKAVKDFLEFGVPEVKRGRMLMIAGNVQNFVGAVRNAEYLAAQPLETFWLVLPDSVKSKVPPVEGVKFVRSTKSGSFADGEELAAEISATDFALLLGDVSANQETAVALAQAIKKSSMSLSYDSQLEQLMADEAKASDTPLLLTRDAVDSVMVYAADFIERENLFYFVTAAQLKKLLHTIMYPKIITLSQPILQVVEVLHKLTLSYPKLTVVTYHSGNILVASGGEVRAVPVSSTEYTPIILWSGNLACKIAAMNTWNPGKPLDATIAALFM